MHETRSTDKATFEPGEHAPEPKDWAPPSQRPHVDAGFEKGLIFGISITVAVAAAIAAIWWLL